MPRGCPTPQRAWETKSRRSAARFWFPRLLTDGHASCDTRQRTAVPTRHPPEASRVARSSRPRRRQLYRRKEEHMKSTWTIGKKLFTATGVLAVLLAASGVVSLWSSSAINDRLINTGEKSVPRLRLAGDLQRDNLRLFTAQEGMVLAAFNNDRKMRDLSNGRLATAHAGLIKEIGEL